MRILLICQQSPHRHPIPACDFWAVYFRQGLAEAGHEVVETPGADWAKGLLPLSPEERAAWCAEVWQRTVETAGEARRGAGLDLVLSYLYPGQIDRGAVNAIRGLGVPTVNFFCDHLREYRAAPAEFGVFDLNWVPEYAALAWYRRRGWRHIHAPMPCWVPPLRRRPPNVENRVVSFVGSRDSLRGELLASPARAGLPLEVRGAGWMPEGAAPKPRPPPPTWAARWRDWRDFARRQGLAASGRRAIARFRRTADGFDFTPFARPRPEADGYQSILAESAVSLGINRFPSFRRPAGRPAAYSRLRDIEAPMLGACYLTEWAEGLDQLYDLENEIVTYRTPDELVGQTRALLRDDHRRRRLRAAAQRRALAEHSVGASLTRILAALGLGGPPR